MVPSTLVVGATGATGKWVVKMLLEKEQKVKVIVRSKQRMLDVLNELSSSDGDGDDDQNKTATAAEAKKNVYGDKLIITEASLLDLTDDQLKEQVEDCQAVVSCLGHTLDFQGMFGHPRNLVTEATRRLTLAMSHGTVIKNRKFILMGSEGVANPSGEDDVRGTVERGILFLLRWLIPPHADNEGAADYVYHSLGKDKTDSSGLEWCVVRPTDLIDSQPTKYTLYNKPTGSLFGSGEVARSTVASFMVDLIQNEETWEQWKFQMPVIHNAKEDETKESTEDETKQSTENETKQSTEDESKQSKEVETKASTGDETNESKEDETNELKKDEPKEPKEEESKEDEKKESEQEETKESKEETTTTTD